MMIFKRRRQDGLQRHGHGDVGEHEDLFKIVNDDEIGDHPDGRHLEYGLEEVHGDLFREKNLVHNGGGIELDLGKIKLQGMGRYLEPHLDDIGEDRGEDHHAKKGEQELPSLGNGAHQLHLQALLGDMETGEVREIEFRHGRHGVIDPAAENVEDQESENDHHGLGELLGLGHLPLLAGLAQLFFARLLGPPLVVG